MKRITRFAIFCYALLVAQLGFSQIPSIADFDRLLDFGESTFSSLLTPPATTTAIAAEGSTWFYRDYGFLAVIPGGSGLVVAVNVTGGGGFAAGDVYALGGAYGSTPVRVDTLTNLLLLVPGSGTGAENGITNPGNGNCVARVSPPQGTIASYSTTATSEGMEVELAFTNTFVSVTATQVTTDSVSTLTNEGFEAELNTRSTSFFEQMGNLLFITEVDSESTLKLSQVGLSDQVTTTNTEFEAPGLFIGPADCVREQMEWVSAVTGSTQTTATAPAPELVLNINSEESTTVVDDVNASVTVEAGSFVTIKTTTTDVNGRVVNWEQVGTGLLIMSEVYEGSDTEPLGVTELTDTNI